MCRIGGTGVSPVREKKDRRDRRPTLRIGLCHSPGLAISAQSIEIEIKRIRLAAFDFARLVG